MKSVGFKGQCAPRYFPHTIQQAKEKTKMYHVAIERRQGKNSQYRTTGKVRIHGNYLELPLGRITYYIELSGIKEIVEREIADEGEPGEILP
jgi:hypothetical protein